MENPLKPKQGEPKKPVILPKVQEYIDRINRGETTLEKLGDIPNTWKQAIRDNTGENMVDSTQENKNEKINTPVEVSPAEEVPVENQIAHIFGQMTEGAMAGLKDDFPKKVKKYADDIRSGKSKEFVLGGLSSSFVSAVEAELLKDQLKELYKSQEIVDLEKYFTEKTQSTAEYKYNPDLVEGSMTLRQLGKDLLAIGGDKIQAHGMTKGNIGHQFKSLLEILQNGTDKDRNNGILYTGPLVIDPELAAGVGAAIGTSGGTAYIDGGFVLVAKKDSLDIRSPEDVGGVLVNEEVFRTLPEIVAKLKAVFPQLSVEPYSKAVNVVNDIIEKS